MNLYGTALFHCQEDGNTDGELRFFFTKAINSINNNLAWLKSNASGFNSAAPKYMEMHLVCMWDHLKYYGTVPHDSHNLETIVTKVSASPLVQRSVQQRGAIVLGDTTSRRSKSKPDRPDAPA